MKINKDRLHNIILEEVRDVINRDPNTPRDKLIALLKECSLALDNASDTYQEMGNTELEDRYMKLGERAYNAANYLAKLR